MRHATDTATPTRAIAPPVKSPRRVGAYPAWTKAGGGYVWDAVLEYRVWLHPERGAPDRYGGNDWFLAFATHEAALAFARAQPGAEAPLALILQREYIDEPRPGQYRHVRARRVAEWPVEFLARPRRDRYTIAEFLSPRAPANRLQVLRGQAPRLPRRRDRRRPDAQPRSASST